MKQGSAGRSFGYPNARTPWARERYRPALLRQIQAQRSMQSGRYVHALFQKMMAYAHSLKPKSIFILSAKYGLLSLDDTIDPYEQTLKPAFAR
jgi:hypothetical protein